MDSLSTAYRFHGLYMIDYDCLSVMLLCVFYPRLKYFSDAKDIS